MHVVVVVCRIIKNFTISGYNDVLIIPAGATNIRVEEIAPSNNYLAVRNTSNYYHLNGNWRINFPRTIEFAGCKFHYERTPQGFPAPDKLSCLGPTDETLFIVVSIVFFLCLLGKFNCKRYET